jgi:hypothetical protein
MADGQTSRINRATDLRVRLLSFSWRHGLKILKGGPFPAILGLDFLRKTRMSLNVPDARFRFAFAPEREGCLFLGESGDLCRECASLLGDSSAQVAMMGQVPLGGLEVSTLRSEFPNLFSPILGMANCEAYVIELFDATPVPSSPYRYAPPNMPS